MLEGYTSRPPHIDLASATAIHNDIPQKLVFPYAESFLAMNDGCRGRIIHECTAVWGKEGARLKLLMSRNDKTIDETIDEVETKRKIHQV